MYTPKHFENTNNDEILGFLRANSFATLVTTGAKTLATHIPLEINETGKVITGHISAANPQAKALEKSDEVLAIFLGPHAYISSSWYNHENVPTWNYIAVHVYGRPRIVTQNQAVPSLKAMVDKYEVASEHPVSLDSMSESYLLKALKGIVAFEIDVTSIKASYKLSQNRDLVNHKRIVHELEKKDDDNSQAIAFEMKKRTPTR